MFILLVVYLYVQYATYCMYTETVSFTTVTMQCVGKNLKLNCSNLYEMDLAVLYNTLHNGLSQFVYILTILNTETSDICDRIQSIKG